MRSVAAALLILFSTWSFAAEPEYLLKNGPPYVPRAFDSSVEMGLATSQLDYIWGAGVFGLRTGECFYSKTSTCNQYWDVLGGIAGREGATQGLALTGLRFQFVNNVDRWSPFIRALGGAAWISNQGERYFRSAGALGFGMTTYLHDKIDLRLELRAIATDRVYGQAVIGFQFKLY